MKKLVFITTVLCLVSISFKGQAQMYEMTKGEPIVIKEVTEGFSKGAISFYQGEKRIKYISILNTLGEYDICSDNYTLAKTHRKRALIMTGIGVVTIPLGYLILIGPIMKNKKKEVKYVKLAIEQYNQSLEAQTNL
jgi:hypothetical protein